MEKVFKKPIKVVFGKFQNLLERKQRNIEGCGESRIQKSPRTALTGALACIIVRK